ncbi:hypothetical protein [Halosimplex rubrum]|uniref:hypothetical protein n=1 Tax=Halosimplex rubrum TaxID=869889 RepID=UPI001FE7533D|nr:hypothetical protein [Halosimplex rubrum]
MSLRRRQQFVSATLAWMLAATLALVVLDAFSVDLFISVSLIGFFVVTELTSPQAVSPTWRRRLYVISALGLALFAYIVVKRILAILPQGVIS